MKAFSLLLGTILSLSLASLSHAALIHTTYNELLPPSSYDQFDFDNDGTNDIALAERVSSPDFAFIFDLELDFGAAAEFMDFTPDFVAAGTLIDSSTLFSTDSFIAPLMSLGSNYMGFVGLSDCASCYGWFQVSYDGTDMYLVDMAYDNSGAAVNAGLLADTASVPEPGTVALFGLGALGFVMARRKRKA